MSACRIDVVYLKNWFHSNTQIQRLLSVSQLHELDKVLEQMPVLSRVDVILNLLLAPADKDWEEEERALLPDFDRWQALRSPKHYKLYVPRAQAQHLPAANGN